MAKDDGLENAIVTPRWLDWVLRTAFLLIVTGLAWSWWPDPSLDASYQPMVEAKSYGPRNEARVVIDTAHANLAREYGPLQKLLSADGYWLRSGLGWFTPDTLARYNVLVIANALGTSGVMNRIAEGLGLGRVLHVPAGAFSGREVATVDRWVREGGALLLVADPGAAADASSPLARAFDVEMTGWRAEDAAHADSRGANPAFIRFSRDTATLAVHPITEGRLPEERIDNVLTFGGQVLRIGAGATPLLVLSQQARAYCGSCESQGRRAGGMALAAALDHGRGRVVIIGNAASVCARTVSAADGSTLQIGLNRDDADNAQFALNIAHWLSRLL